MLSRPQLSLITVLFVAITFTISFSHPRFRSGFALLAAHNQSEVPAPPPTPQGIPRRIWQTWKVGPQKLEGEVQQWSATWVEKNPKHRYELITDNAAVLYVRDRFQDRPDIVRVFDRLTDPILRADYLRYLLLLKDGGVYSDIDTECTRKIDEWIPCEYRNSTNMVVGIEWDQRDGGMWPYFDHPVQFAQWTFMAQHGHPIMQLLVDRITSALREYEDQGKLHKVTMKDILSVSGPTAFTDAVMEGFRLAGNNVTFSDIAYLEEPKLIGDVLVLPVSAFGAGQAHSGSKEIGNEDQLMWHHFFQSWWNDSHEDDIHNHEEDNHEEDNHEEDNHEEDNHEADLQEDDNNKESD